jgi:hypothetical protein
MAADAGEVIRGELLRGEKLLWSGQPLPGLRFSTADWLAVPFSLIWCSMVGVWELAAFERGGSPLVVLFGVPFVAFGLYMLAGRFLVDAAVRARTFYGVTATRVIIVVVGWRSRTVHSVDLANTQDVTMQERGDGTGSITFVDLPLLAQMASHTRHGGPKPPSLEFIPGVRTVFTRIRELQVAIRMPAPLPPGDA